MSEHQEREGSATSQSTHAGIFVLSNRGLWDCITDFMIGYPFTVLQFYQAHDPQTWFDRHAQGISSDAIGIFTWQGVLPHLAIVANDLKMLQLLHRLSKKPCYRDDLKFSFQRAMCCAVLYNNVEMLELIDRLKADDRSWTREANLLRLALEREDPDVRVLDWLLEYIPPVSAKVWEKYMRRHTERGNLDVVKRLHQRKRDVSEAAMDVAAKQGHLHVLRYFYAQSEKRCSSAAIEFAAVNGFVDIVKFAFENQKQPVLNLERVISGAALHGHLELARYFVESDISFKVVPVVDSAAEGGHLEIVEYLINRFDGCCTDYAMFYAGEKGHLEVLKFLHEHRIEKCHSHTLTRAAANGHLEVVKFLHETCGLSISSYDLSITAENGHLEVVKFVHQHCAEECSPSAMDDAAAGGHLEVVEFLHFNSKGGCTAAALEAAASKGHLGVIKFLCEHRSEGDVMVALTAAIHRRNVKVVKALHGYLQAGQSLYGRIAFIAGGFKWGMLDITTFLCEDQECETTSFLLQAVAKRSSSVAGLVMLHASLDELVAAKEYALSLNGSSMAEIIARGIISKTSRPIGE